MCNNYSSSYHHPGPLFNPSYSVFSAATEVLFCIQILKTRPTRLSCICFICPSRKARVRHPLTSTSTKDKGQVGWWQCHTCLITHGHCFIKWQSFKAAHGSSHRCVVRFESLGVGHSISGVDLEDAWSLWRIRGKWQPLGAARKED